MVPKNLREEAERRGRTYGKYLIFKILKQNLIRECHEQHNKNWANKINSIKKSI